MFCMVKSANKLKKPKCSTLIIIDLQAVKNTCNASVESKGFCAAILIMKIQLVLGGMSSSRP